MTSRERLQYVYELAFYPPRLNEVWHQLAKQPLESTGELGELLDQAWLLHQALPERGYASQRALNRLALYQARARAFGMVTFLRNIRQYMGRPPVVAHVVPGSMVRDIGLPPLTRHRP
jgi:hypothetical protein